MIRLLVLFAFLLCHQVAQAAGLVVGATREEVISALGEPVGRSSAGSREVLSYAEGRVFLRDGKVEEIDAALVPAAPAPAPAAPSPAPAVVEPAAKPPSPPPAPVEVPAEAGGNWIKLAGLTVFLGVVFLLGRHWIREARRAQEEKKRDLLSR